MASVTSKKVDGLYGKLGKKERVRMLAKLSREHDIAGMEKLRNATPTEHADAYNHALKLLRVLNGNLLDWVALFKTGMERDRFRFQHGLREALIMNLMRYQLSEMWRFIKYPVTESEYKTILQRQRSEPLSLDGYAEMLAESDEDEPGLHPAIAEYLRTLPPELERLYVDDDSPKPGTPEFNEILQESQRRNDVIEKGIRAIIDDAIKKGELPKPKKHEGELSLPWGVLSDWGEGTTEETWELLGPSSGEFVPMLRMFEALFGADWDIHPDSEADFVKKEREQMLQRLPMMPTTPREVRDEIGSLDPPMTEKERQRDWKRMEALRAKWSDESGITTLLHEAAATHAEYRYQLAGMREAIEILQRDDFYGEDPLWPESRAQLDEAQEEADRFAETWDGVDALDWDTRRELLKLQGIEPPEIVPHMDLDEIAKPIPMPEKEPNTETMLQLIRGWVEW